VRTLKEGTRARAAFLEIEPITVQPVMGRMAYYLWPGGIVPDDGGAAASNRPLKPMRVYIDYGAVFCAWFPNAMLRAVGKRVPRAQMQGYEYDGGIAAYWGSASFPQIGAGYFAGYMDAFDMETAVRWAYNDRAPVLCGWRYVNAGANMQGHVFIVFPSGWILESVLGVGPRWVWWENYPLWRYATVMVRGLNWINYRGDEF